MKCPRCQQDNPSHAKFCLECGVPFQPTHESGPAAASYIDLQRALTEALESRRRPATSCASSQVLQPMSNLPSTRSSPAPRGCVTPIGAHSYFGEVSQAISSTLDLPTVLSTIVARSPMPMASGRQRTVDEHRRQGRLREDPPPRPYRPRPKSGEIF